MKIAFVKWLDAWTDASQDFSSEDAKTLFPIERTTVGYYVGENDQCMILATDFYDEDKSFNCPMIIPLDMIKFISFIDVENIENETENPLH